VDYSNSFCYYSKSCAFSSSYSDKICLSLILYYRYRLYYLTATYHYFTYSILRKYNIAVKVFISNYEELVAT